jgi:hypothetical protein
MIINVTANLILGALNIVMLIANLTLILARNKLRTGAQRK